MAQMDTWELDFFSRPLLDEEGKRIWELLVCARQTGACYQVVCSAKEANSGWLTAQLQTLIAQAPQAPALVYFFRPIMTGMIERSCKQLDLEPRLSLRSFRVRRWLQERERTIYPQMAGYQAPQTSPSALETINPQPLPDMLRGDQWALVSLSAHDLAASPPVQFGDQIALDLTPRTRVPGLVIFSTRALAMSAWLQGVDPVALRYQPDPAHLILEVGNGEQWILARLRQAGLQQEAQGFAQSLQGSDGVHFLAIQISPQSEVPTGFWTLWAAP